jgi:rhodanese-related sulfurtransferase
MAFFMPIDDRQADLLTRCAIANSESVQYPYLSHSGDELLQLSSCFSTTCIRSANFFKNWHKSCKQQCQTSTPGSSLSTSVHLKGTNMNLLKPTLLAIALALTASVSFAQQEPAAAKTAAAPVYKGKVPKLTREALDAYLAKPEQVVILDVRRPDEVTAIGGFPVYLSIQSKELEKSTAFIPRDRGIITVSNHAGRAGGAANLLLDKGFNVVGAVGAQDYEAEGGKLTKISPPAPKQATAPAAAPKV